MSLHIMEYAADDTLPGLIPVIPRESLLQIVTAGGWLTDTDAGYGDDHPRTIALPLFLTCKGLAWLGDLRFLHYYEYCLPCVETLDIWGVMRGPWYCYVWLYSGGIALEGFAYHDGENTHVGDSVFTREPQYTPYPRIVNGERCYTPDRCCGVSYAKTAAECMCADCAQLLAAETLLRKIDPIAFTAAEAGNGLRIKDPIPAEAFAAIKFVPWVADDQSSE